jgi:H+/Cl- antiporter ClcA
MLAGSMNIPLAAAVMTTELFGLQYSFPAGFSAIIGFQVMRHRTIYDYAVSGLIASDAQEDNK